MDVVHIDSAPDEREDRIRMVRESAEAVLRDDIRRARALRFGTAGYDPAKLEEFAALGWMMTLLPEADGGLGMGLGELVAIASQLGRNLTPEPVLPMALVASILADAGLLEGRRVVLPGLARAGRPAPVFSGGRVTGEVEPVLLGGAASALLVETDRGAALVEAGAEGLTLDIRETHDGGHVAMPRLDGTPALPVDGDMALLREKAVLAHAACCLGLAEAAFEITCVYLKDRQQFGRPIGAFQALQHRMVDLLLELALARATVEQAADTIDRAPAGRREVQRQVSLARLQAGKAADIVTRSAIQLHGGIGYTDEADIGLYLRRSMTLSGLLGSGDFHQMRAFELQKERT